jgi:8-oxo-dGTP diphosphatase
MNDNIKKIQRVTAKAVITRDNKFLLVEEPDHRWEFPGGKIEFGDTPEETLKRELQEELGLTEDLKIGPILNAWSWVFKFEVHLQFFLLAYSCETSQTEFRLSHEHIKYGWFTKDEALKLNLTEGTRQTLEKIVE